MWVVREVKKNGRKVYCRKWRLSKRTKLIIAVYIMFLMNLFMGYKILLELKG